MGGASIELMRRLEPAGRHVRSSAKNGLNRTAMHHGSTRRAPSGGGGEWLNTSSIASAPRETPTRSRSISIAPGSIWEPVGLDFAGGVTRDAHWRAGTNLMGEVPVLEIAGKRMSQSGAILLWLAETTASSRRRTISASRPCAGCFSTITNSPRTTRCIGFSVASRRGRSIRPSWLSCGHASKRRSRLSRSISRSTFHARRQADHRGFLHGRLHFYPAARPASISLRTIRRSMRGAGALLRCRAGSRPTS